MRSEDDRAAAVVGSDRALALNVEMASWKVKSCVRVHQLCGAWQRIYSTAKCHGSRAVAFEDSLNFDAPDRANARGSHAQAKTANRLLSSRSIGSCKKIKKA